MPSQSTATNERYQPSSWASTSEAPEREAFKRAMSVASVGTVLLQITVSRVVQAITNRQLGIQSTLPRKPGSGDKFVSVRRAAAATGGSWVNDTEEPISQEGTYTQDNTNFYYRTMLGRTKVTRKAMATGRSWGDLLATELINKADDFVNDLESASVIGDNAADAKQMNGLLTLIGVVSGQSIANTTASTGDDLSLSLLDKTIQKVKGHSNKASMRIFLNYAGGRRLNAALQAQQRFNDSTVIDAGFIVQTYQGIPIVESTGIPDTLTFNATTGQPLAFTGGTTTAIIVVNTTYIFYSELTPMTVMPVARVSSQYDTVDMFMDISLVQDNPLGAAVLTGLSTS